MAGGKFAQISDLLILSYNYLNDTECKINKYKINMCENKMKK